MNVSISTYFIIFMYRAEGWRGTVIVQPQFWDKVSANNRLRSNASTEPVQIPVLAWYRCLVPRQYRWTTFSQVTFRSRADGRQCLCQYRASTENPSAILAQYQAGCKFPSGMMSLCDKTYFSRLVTGKFENIRIPNSIVIVYCVLRKRNATYWLMPWSHQSTVKQIIFAVSRQAPKSKWPLRYTHWQFKLSMRDLVVDKRTNRYGYRWASRSIVYTILKPDAHSVTQ